MGVLISRKTSLVSMLLCVFKCCLLLMNIDLDLKDCSRRERLFLRLLLMFFFVDARVLKK